MIEVILYLFISVNGVERVVPFGTWGTMSECLVVAQEAKKWKFFDAVNKRIIMCKEIDVTKE
jgi:hypothetical protein